MVGNTDFKIGQCLSLKLHLYFCHGERSPNDPAKRSEGESNHPENFSLTMVRQGVLPRVRHFVAITACKAKCMEENSLTPNGK